MYKSGFAAVIGRPNVGKSTLLNTLLGEKISVVSDRAQTTRNEIKIIYTDSRMQIVFLDTPGVQTPKNELGKYMLNVSNGALKDVDLVLVLFDTSDHIGRLDTQILEEIAKIDIPKILVINKIDTEEQNDVNNLVNKYEDLHLFNAVVPISALEKKNINNLLDSIYDNLNEGPQYYPDDMVTDRSERFVVSEMIREKALKNLRDEIPHGIFVGIDKMTDRKDKDVVDIFATIFVEKNSHKGMVIGKNGSMLKIIGTQARKDIERLIAKKANLKLWVKVEKDWRKKKNKLKEFGYE